MANSNFLTRLKQFSQSVDIITEADMKDIAKNVVAEYLRNRYSVKVFALLEQFQVKIGAGNMKTALRTFYSMQGPEWNELLRDTDTNSYMGQVSYCFEHGRNMWVQCEDGSPLGYGENESYIDHWNYSLNIPPKIRDNEIKTSTGVYVPLSIKTNQRARNAQQKLGVMIVEFENVVEITDEFKEEFKDLALIFSIFYTLQIANQVQRSNTSGVITEMTRLAYQEIPAQQQDSGNLPEDIENRVFVIHGRNLAARNAVFDFLRKIQLNPIEWDEAVQATGQPNAFVMDIVTSGFNQAQAMVVILTGDDEARLRESFWRENEEDMEKTYQPQARPNVIFEAGIALGRFASRTVILQFGDVRPFSDISGMYILKISQDSVIARKQIANRLKLAGCTPNTDGTDWLETGAFDEAIQALN